MAAQAAAISVSSASTREELRTQNQVRLIDPQHEGKGIARVPTGTYGFTYAPGTETPVFAKPGYGTFEVHRHPGGSGAVIGYCANADFERLCNAQDAFEMELYPDSYGSATQLVAIPFELLEGQVYKPVRRDGNAVTFHVAFL